MGGGGSREKFLSPHNRGDLQKTPKKKNQTTTKASMTGPGEQKEGKEKDLPNGEKSFIVRLLAYVGDCETEEEMSKRKVDKR